MEYVLEIIKAAEPKVQLRRDPSYPPESIWKYYNIKNVSKTKRKEAKEQCVL